MRRRQQQQQQQQRPRQPPHHHGGTENYSPPNNNVENWRGARSPPRLLALAFVTALVLVLGCNALGRLGVARAPPPRESLSARAGNGDGIRGRKIQRRVIAVGDIHGDRDALVRALRLGGLVGENGSAWIGGSDVVVQIGDLLNKAEERDEETLSYITEIEGLARGAGGAVIVTVGDHDLRNAPRLWRGMHPSNETFPSWIRASYVMDKTLFVHGSLSRKSLVDAGGSLVDMNREAEAWLAGRAKKPGWIGRGDGPVWSRLFSDKASNEDPRCEELRELLGLLSIERMVVGHTIRREGISSLCDGKVWRIDVGLSRTETRAGRIGASEVLEINHGGASVRVLRTDAKLKSWKL